MPTYQVIRKADGIEIYQYSADAPIEWVGMEFSTHDHALMPTISVDAPNDASPRRLTKLQFIEKLGDAAFAAILQMAKVSSDVEAWVKKMELTTPDPDGTSVDLDDPRTMAGVRAIGAILAEHGVVTAGWADEVLA